MMQAIVKIGFTIIMIELLIILTGCAHKPSGYNGHACNASGYYNCQCNNDGSVYYCK